MFRFGDPGGRMYGSAAFLLAHWTSTTTGSWTVVTSGGRTTGSCLRLAAGNAVWLGKVLDSQPVWGLAFAFRTSNFNNNLAPLAGLLDGFNIQVDLRVNNDGSLTVTRNGTTLASTAAGVLSLNAWAHLELKVTIDPSAGAARLWVNGVQKLNLTGQNTRATGNSSANTVFIGAPVGGITPVNWDYDDVIFYDGQATDANGFADITGPIGDCGLAWLLPTGAGATTQFTPDSGANYARVNEATPDGDTSYVESATVGNIDTYAMADLPAGATAVKSVATVHYARKTDVGTRGMKAELRSAGGNAAHATEIALGNSYQYYFSNWGRDPNNGTPADWTAAAVNALEAGQTVSS